MLYFLVRIFCRFREALQRQSESFHRQLESTEAELRQALHSVQERDAQIRTLQAENDALKETVASMVSLQALFVGQ